MPPRMKKTLDAEKQLAANITKYRKERGLTYEGLAERMKAIGFELHFSGIQKSEKSGRRITVEELAAYSLALDVPVLELLGLASPDVEAEKGMSDFYAAIRLKRVVLMLNAEYLQMIEPLRARAASNPELLAQVQDRFDQETKALQEHYGVFPEDGADFDERLQLSAAFVTARDVLNHEEEDHG